ncbi:hypothetical protein MTO96_016152 [Rhipicephalus appendiculatus]
MLLRNSYQHADLVRGQSGLVAVHPRRRPRNQGGRRREAGHQTTNAQNVSDGIYPGHADHVQTGRSAQIGRRTTSGALA